MVQTTTRVTLLDAGGQGHCGYSFCPTLSMCHILLHMTCAPSAYKTVSARKCTALLKDALHWIGCSTVATQPSGLEAYLWGVTIRHFWNRVENLVNLSRYVSAGVLVPLSHPAITFHLLRTADVLKVCTTSGQIWRSGTMPRYDMGRGQL